MSDNYYFVWTRLCYVSVIPLQHRSCSVCMSFVRLGHHNGFPRWETALVVTIYFSRNKTQSSSNTAYKYKQKQKALNSEQNIQNATNIRNKIHGMLLLNCLIFCSEFVLFVFACSSMPCILDRRQREYMACYYTQ